MATAPPLPFGYAHLLRRLEHPGCTLRGDRVHPRGLRRVDAGGGRRSTRARGGRDLSELVIRNATTLPQAPVALGDPNLIQYTSGTPGFPKGATHSVSTLLWNSSHQIGDFLIVPEERYLCVPALCWAAGLHDFTLATLWAGGRVVLQPSGGVTIEGLLRMVDGEDPELPPGAIGEVVMRSPATMVGYGGRPEETAAVLGRPDQRWGEPGCAVVVAKPGATVDLAPREARCRSTLASYKVPRRFVVRDEASPRTASGKVRKFALREQLGP